MVRFIVAINNHLARQLMKSSNAVYMLRAACVHEKYQERGKIYGGNKMLNVLERKKIKELSFPIEGYNYNVQIIRSVDGGHSWWYTGDGKYFKTLEDAQEFAK